MKNTFLILILVVMATLFFDCSRAGQVEDKPAKKAEQQKETPKAQKGEKDGKEADTDAVPVQVISPRVGDITSFLLFSSNIDSEKVVDIYPMTSGIIEKINAHEGDTVKKGHVLAVLDDREASLNEEKAELNYRKLKSEFDRQQEIFQKELISKEDYERLRYSMENAFLEWKQQKLLLSYTRITTPITGVVSRRYIKAGNKITTGQMAFSVVNTREKIAVVNIPAQEKEHIYLKQKSLISAAGDPITGKVKRISPSIDPESGTFKVTVELNDPKNQLSVGQFVNVKVIKKVHQNVVLLRKDALIFDGGKTFVFIIDKDNKAQKKLIVTDFEDGSQVEVIKGLTAKDRVVTAGKSSLKSDTLVRVIEPVILD